MVKRVNKGSPILYVIKFFLRERPLYLVVTFFEKIIWSFTYVFTSVYLLKILFDYIQNKIALTRIIILILSTALLCLTVYLINVIFNHVYKPKVQASLSEKIKLSIYKKYIAMPLMQFESNDIDENYFFILSDSPSRFFAVINDFANLIGQIISMLFIIGIMASIDYYLIIIMLPFSTLFFFLNLKKNKIVFEKEMSIVKQNKEKEYINRLFYLPQYAKELRCTNISKMAFNRFSECYCDLQKKVSVFGKKIISVECISYLVTSLIFDLLLLLYLTLRLVIYKAITIGDYTAVINSVWKLYDNVNNILGYFSKFKLHSNYIRKYLNFVYLEPKKTLEGWKPEKFESLSLNNISFSYNDNIKTVDDICLQITDGQKIAIVGYNGAGKTTLIKLIMGLYCANSGQMLYNCMEYSQYSTDDLIRKFRLVSQDNNLYAITFAENVFMNNYVEMQRDEYEHICKRSRLDSLIQKHAIIPESNMTSEFDENGIILSGGETQLVSLSRLFSFKSADVYILDEPSSALDVFQESSVNEILMNTDKTLIVITHKLGIIKSFDKIYFMDNGKIIESGTHSELMELKGKYYELYTSQKRMYNKSTDNGV